MEALPSKKKAIMASRKKSEKAPEPQASVAESGTKPQSHASDSASEEKERDTARQGKAFSGLPVVGMVASAGGLDAFKKFFSAMPPDSGVAFVLIPHLDPTHESLMAELLARQTSMTVVEAEEGMRVEANHVYIIPPNKYMTMSGGALRLTGPVERRGVQSPIDLFLRSMADDQQELAICIILSGTGGHGALGLKAVKAAGGMSMVQDPKSAEYDHMPSSAVATGLADFVLPPEFIARELKRIASHVHVFAAEDMKVFWASLNELPGLNRQAFIMGRIDDLSTPEIAKRLNRSERMIRRYIVHALIYCRHRIEGMTPEQAKERTRRDHPASQQATERANSE